MSLYVAGHKVKKDWLEPTGYRLLSKRVFFNKKQDYLAWAGNDYRIFNTKEECFDWLDKLFIKYGEKHLSKKIKPIKITDIK